MITKKRLPWLYDSTIRLFDRIILQSSKKRNRKG